jgi:tRNA(Leu) C34 or U34 (ribose-2'-O)-methylase TrmL
MGINTLVADLNYGSNIGQIARTHHVLGGESTLYLFDPRGIIHESADEVSRFSCGIFDNGQHEIIDGIEAFLRGYRGRRIATELSPDATPLTEFEFQDEDLILFGNERVGLPGSVITTCDETIIVPMLGAPYTKKDYRPEEPIKGVGEYPTFNIAATYAMVMYTAMAQLRAFKDFKWDCWKPEE